MLLQQKLVRLVPRLGYGADTAVKSEQGWTSQCCNTLPGARCRVDRSCWQHDGCLLGNQALIYALLCTPLLGAGLDDAVGDLCHSRRQAWWAAARQGSASISSRTGRMVEDCGQPLSHGSAAAMQPQQHRDPGVFNRSPMTVIASLPLPPVNPHRCACEHRRPTVCCRWAHNQPLPAQAQPACLACPPRCP